jgi:lipopolysaccharide transport system ATP-binding protein
MKMSDSIIEVNGLSKRYILSHERQGNYTALRDVITDKVKGLVNKQQNLKAPSQEEFWALKDVEFNIKQGDRVGVIGRNGAGKSTLLKILSRITEPTSGSIKIKGRVASLLEVGTGFHPELTGRENIFLNGAILGMSRTEIRKKFDEIVDFAEVERFLDTPVKRYSSGMYVRLAFAIAAHLEPEILIVDEVLAVGDSNFQKKCLGKMEEVSKEGGRTVLFVSHNMIAIQNLCNDIILMNKGSIVFHGDRAKGMILYEKLNKETGKGINLNLDETHISFSFHCENSNNPESINSHSKIVFDVEINSKKNYGKSWINIVIDDNEGKTVGHIRNDWYNYSIYVNEGHHKFEIEIDGIMLTPGVYNIWTRVVLSEEVLIFDSNPLMVEVRGIHLFGNINYKTQWKKLL